MTPGKQRPLFRADHVGSLLRPQRLKDAARKFHVGELGADAFKRVQDDCIREAVAMQEEVGLQSITDGEFRRGSWFGGFIDAVEGVSDNDSLFTFHDDAHGGVAFRTAYVNGKLRRTRGIATAEFAFVRAITRQTPKVTLPTPSLLHFFRGDQAVAKEAYADLDAFWADLIAIYRAELADLAGAGCTVVQLDEVPVAMLCDPAIREQTKTVLKLDPDALATRYIAALNEAVAGAPDGVTVALHLCKGNYKGQWMAQGGYDAIAERLFNEADVDVFFLEYDTERAGGFEPLRHVPADKGVVLGLVSSKTPVLETVDYLKRRIDAASRFVPFDRLGVSPQCGFASSVGGNPLTVDDEKRKLARVVEVADAMWG